MQLSIIGEPSVGIRIVLHALRQFLTGSVLFPDEIICQHLSDAFRRDCLTEIIAYGAVHIIEHLITQGA